MSSSELPVVHPSSPDTVEWIAGLPKVELHVHLEGSLSPTTMGLLAARHGVSTEEIWPGGLPERFSFDGFPMDRSMMGGPTGGIGRTWRT
jgi:Adenosine deaminase